MAWSPTALTTDKLSVAEFVGLVSTELGLSLPMKRALTTFADFASDALVDHPEETVSEEELSIHFELLEHRANLRENLIYTLNHALDNWIEDEPRAIRHIERAVKLVAKVTSFGPSLFKECLLERVMSTSWDDIEQQTFIDYSMDVLVVAVEETFSQD